jgi:hypothetical protein
MPSAILRPLPARAFTTHQVLSPSDRTIVAACEQVGCLRWRHGWDSMVDERNEEGRALAHLIRSGEHGRTYRELPGRDALGRTVFRFDSRQRCFAEHRTRPELFVVRDGTPSQQAGPAKRFTRPADWFDHYHETFDRRLVSRQKG